MHMEKQSERLRRSHRIYADGIMLCGCAWGDCLYVQGVWRYLEYDKLSVSTLFLYYLLFGGDAKTNTFKNMKKVRMMIACAALALAMTGCGTVGMVGVVYTGYTEPVLATGNPVGYKCGTASSVSILGIAAIGDGGINKAAKNASITQISHVDKKTVSILGIFTTCKYFVYGE